MTEDQGFAEETKEDVGAMGPEAGQKYSHILVLASGKRVYHLADDMDPHAALPTNVDGDPVVSVSHATVGGPA